MREGGTPSGKLKRNGISAALMKKENERAPSAQTIVGEYADAGNVY